MRPQKRWGWLTLMVVLFIAAGAAAAANWATPRPGLAVMCALLTLGALASMVKGNPR